MIPCLNLEGNLVVVCIAIQISWILLNHLVEGRYIQSENHWSSTGAFGDAESQRLSVR
ncbi:hypothetical protein DPMN_154961 [Dreissena polymorpha]|uniref:Uncharacterized protein n=1 Tax=Dreissena polymorpha TaxID=45954 RepID=A0A9D4FQB6_DREPO|nr:hypothetical protein DPMN_154961 [Dreissena polymorpha]